MSSPITAADLLPSKELSPGKEPGTWVAIGESPEFFIPRELPAGWIHLRLNMNADARGQAELCIEHGDGVVAVPLGEIHTTLEVNRYLRLDKPAVAVRLKPLSQPGAFRINTFSIQTVSRLELAWLSLKSKLREMKTRGNFGRALRHGLGLLLSGNFRAFKAKLVQSLAGAPAGTSLYELWREQNKLSDADRERLWAEAKTIPNQPRISLLMPHYVASDHRHRGGLLETVIRQYYANWELCSASVGFCMQAFTPVDDRMSQNTPGGYDRDLIRANFGKVGRFKIAFGNHASTAAALNAALEVATGDYIAVLGDEDGLAHHALFAVAKATAAGPAADVIYTDEDKLDSADRHIEPFFKPDWSPEYFLSTFYTHRLCVFRTSLVREAGGFREGFAGVEEADLLLRLMAKGARVVHIPEILYHATVRGVASGLCWHTDAEEQEAARRALTDYLAATKQDATIETGIAPGTQRVRYRIRGEPKVSIIIPSRCQPVNIRGETTAYTLKCIESIREKSTWKALEIFVLDRNEMPPEMEKKLGALGARRIAYSEPFNWSRVNNLGASKAGGEHLLFLNDDIEVITADWLEAMLEYSQQEGIGAVGAKLFFPNGNIQHAGVTITGGNPGHPYYNAPAGDPGYFLSNVAVRNFSAVTGGCLMTRAEVFRALGGFNEAFRLNYNDVDYCLKAVTSGRRVVFTPYAQCYHHESVSKTRTYPEELELFRKTWPQWVERDPYFSAHALEFANC